MTQEEQNVDAFNRARILSLLLPAEGSKEDISLFLDAPEEEFPGHRERSWVEFTEDPTDVSIL